MNEQKAPEQQGCLQRAGRIAGIVVLAIVTIVCFVALVTREPLYRRWAPEGERPVPDARVIEALNGAGDEGAAAGGEETAATEEDPAEAGQNPITTEADPATTEEETMADNLTLTVGGATFAVTLEDTAAARELAARLPLTLAMSELNGNEKYAYLDDPLPTAVSRPETIHAGDVMLFGDSCLVLFYETFQASYSYTPVGHVDDPSGLAEALGSGDVTVSWS